MTDLKKIYEDLKDITLEERVFLIIQLMKERKLSYQDITTAYVNWLKYQEENISDDYQQLKSKVLEIWCYPAKERNTRLKDTMHYLLDKGQVNISHEQINTKDLTK